MRLGDVKPEVKIRFFGYGRDYALVQEIEKLFKEHTDWTVALDGTNNPVLRPDPKFKVVFESGLFGSFNRVAAAFSEGELLKVPIGWASSDRQDHHRLIVLIAPYIEVS